MKNNTVFVLLAGGKSERMGTDKGLLKFQENYWILEQLNRISESTIQEVYIGLGFHSQNYFNTIPNNCLDKTGTIDLKERIQDLTNCDFFIGLGSGLSWLAWACKKPVILISGFSSPDSEFYTPYRVHNDKVCNII